MMPVLKDFALCQAHGTGAYYDCRDDRTYACIPTMVNVIEAPTELTARQHAAVAFRGGNLLVEAVPGSGKTRVIVARCRALLAEGVAASEILLLTFSRRAAGELGARLRSVLASDALPDIRTFHGFAARLLTDTGDAGRARRLLCEPAERALFETVIAMTPLPSLPRGAAGSPLFREAASVRVAEIRRSAPGAVARLAGRATSRVADLIALEATQQRVRERLGVADYDDLVARAVELASLPGSAVANALRGRYRHVLVDEFQDTDPLQLALLACLRAEIFAVGDAAQAIYGFRGAARDAMERAENTLAMRRLALDESFRCPANVCELAASVMPGNVALRSAVPKRGAIAFRRAASPQDEAAFIGERIAAEIAAGTRQSEIAVLVRSAEPMARLVERELRARGIAVARHGGENVLDDLAVDAICTALKALANAGEPEAWVRLLGHPAFEISPLALRLALTATPPRSVEEACALVADLRTPSRVPTERLAAALRAARSHWIANEPVLAARAFAAAADVLGFAIAGDENDARRSGARIVNMLDALDDVRDVRAKLDLDTSSAAVFAAFCASSEAWRAGGEAVDDEPGVRILTVHAAKGLEFDFVAIADAVDDRFPQAWRADALLGPDELATARDCGVDLGLLPGEHDAEERSLWYVAVTRSKGNLLVTWAETALDGSPMRPSRFIPLGERVRERERESFRGRLEYTRPEALAENQPPAAVRLERPVRTSGMETWLSCRRKFYYRTLLRIDNEERGFNAKLGTLVHGAIERFHAVVRDFRSVATGAHVAWTRTLQALALDVARSDRFEAFDSTLEFEAATRSANRMLARYARDLESSAHASEGGFEVVGSERRVAYEFAGIAFSGTIDRIDRRPDGSLALVDVKTGKLKDGGAMVKAFPKLAEAALGETLWVKETPPGNPQLALYRYAEADTGMLSYLYLGAPTKPGKFADVATNDVLEVATNAEALAAIDTVLMETFFIPWNTGAVTSLDPTRNYRTCRFCEFVTVCPGYLEDEE
jgi:DNA helicase-2/ATP-dependent DNA helicase PcrA